MKIILQILTEQYSTKFLIIPIYFYRGFCYCSYAYAQKFNNTRLLNLINSDLYIENLVPQSILLRMDINFSLGMSPKVASWFTRQKNNQVFLVQIIHDLIPLVYPQFTEEMYALEFAREFKIAAKYFDLSIAVSKTVMHEYQEWLKLNSDNTKMKHAYLHWGADIDKYSLPAKVTNLIPDFKFMANEYFLMVSRIEPRKDYAIVIDAFEQLWSEGYAKSLVIVGSEAFKTVKLIKRIKTHSELNKKLFWLNHGVSDYELTYLYANTRAFIMASYAEGFGLGVIEAARHHKPLILRDIPVFHEIVGDHAYYFNSKNGLELADSIVKWEDLYKDNLHPQTDNLNPITWAESCANLINIITDVKNTKYTVMLN
jgi:glycosyltransferase involved in cell wall biosynthesis